VAIEVTMPQMGADMTEGTVVRWLKKVGDTIQRGEPIAEIETDKATVELEAWESGVLQKLVVQEGETVPVGEVIAILGAEGEEIPDVERKPAAETPARRGSARDAESGRVAAIEIHERAAAAAEEAEPAAARGAAPPGRADGAGAPPAPGGRIRISPVARRIASESGVDVSAIRGTGPGGRILRRDVEAALAGAAQPPAREEAAEAVRPTPAAPSPAPEPRPRPAAPGAAPVQALSRMRQAIARRMAQSKREQPHYYLTLDIDMTDALAFRKQLNEAATEEQRVSINDLVVKACALALERHPKFNAEFADDGLRFHPQVNIAMGIALDEGLIAPALLDVGHKTLGQIAREAKDLIDRAKNGRLRADEYGSGTFTITNLGAYGVETLIGIINPPQAAILGVGSVMPKAVVRDGQIVARDVMKVALSADHRVTDGAEGARFIKEIQGLLENPASLAL
jgi:pyruvate dehydrogenase E2 component (dihydrolipoamide acetyltransferase)